MTPWLDDGDVTLFHGDALEQLALMPSESVQCIVTSPPFFALRDYGVDGQIGLEASPEAWCDALVSVFREARRVLRSDGCMWLEVGDTYAANRPYQVTDNKHTGVGNNGAMTVPEGMKAKDLMGCPWLLAFALRQDGWHLRAETIWDKPNGMPEAVKDRPTRSHSTVFLLSKAARYSYTGDEMRSESGANARSVWRISTESNPHAHFAVMPEALASRCILAGSREGDTVLDPFSGSGTTCLIARRLGRCAIGVELNLDYLRISAKRLQQLSLLSGT